MNGKQLSRITIKHIDTKDIYRVVPLPKKYLHLRNHCLLQTHSNRRGDGERTERKRKREKQRDEGPQKMLGNQHYL